MFINNLSDYAKARKYILYTLVDGQAWFFSAWDDLKSASRQALECGCEIIESEKVEG